MFSDLSEQNVSPFPILLLHLPENPNTYAEHRSVKIPALYLYLCVYVALLTFVLSANVHICLCVHLIILRFYFHGHLVSHGYVCIIGTYARMTICMHVCMDGWMDAAVQAYIHLCIHLTGHIL